MSLIKNLLICSNTQQLGLYPGCTNQDTSCVLDSRVERRVISVKSSSNTMYFIRLEYYISAASLQTNPPFFSNLIISIFKSSFSTRVMKSVENPHRYYSCLDQLQISFETAIRFKSPNPKSFQGDRLAIVCTEASFASRHLLRLACLELKAGAYKLKRLQVSQPLSCFIKLIV